VERLGWVLVHSVWQFTIIALAALVLQRTMRRSSSAARYWVLLMALGAMLAAPVATWLALPDESKIGGASVASDEAAKRPGQADESATAEAEPDSTPQLPITTNPLPT